MLSVVPVMDIFAPEVTAPPFVVSSNIPVPFPIRTLSLIVMGLPLVIMFAFNVVVPSGPSSVIDALPAPVI